MRIQVRSGALAALFGAALVTAQAPTGPSLQAAADPRYKSVIDTCKTPPPAPAARGGGPAGGGRGAAPAAAPAPGAAMVTALPGVIEAGQKWTKVWETSGNNADHAIKFARLASAYAIELAKTAPVASIDYSGTTTLIESTTPSEGSRAWLLGILAALGAAGIYLSRRITG